MLLAKSPKLKALRYFGKDFFKKMITFIPKIRIIELINPTICKIFMKLKKIIALTIIPIKKSVILLRNSFDFFRSDNFCIL